ncbi:hypothetical protein G7046_g4420 [Stylonectria norvegica]|nr:hypothetical protein G7046_g4420 [Stylonectria norvegica]
MEGDFEFEFEGEDEDNVSFNMDVLSAIDAGTWHEHEHDWGNPGQRVALISITIKPSLFPYSYVSLRHIPTSSVHLCARAPPTTESPAKSDIVSFNPGSNLQLQHHQPGDLAPETITTEVVRPSPAIFRTFLRQAGISLLALPQAQVPSSCFPLPLHAVLMASAMQPGRKRPLELVPVPEILRPLIRAYLLGYASTIAPRLLTLLLQHVARRRRKCISPERDNRTFVQSATHILKTGLQCQRFPTFCAVLVGGSTLLQEPLRSILEKVARGLSDAARLRLARWISAFTAAWLSLRLLQSKESVAYSETAAGLPTDAKPQTVRFAGKTMDLTLFAATRALDVVIGDLWSRHRRRRQVSQGWTMAEQGVSNLVDPLVFVASCGFIMWSWVFTPEKLPQGYNKWIASAAAVDPRLVEALRRLRSGQMQYGKETGQTPLLGEMCADYKWPADWGDPVKAIPFRCEMVHMGCGPSCEYHAFSRFFRAWKWSMVTYFPVALALKLRNPSRKAFMQALSSSSRSATFLGAFITLFYYGVCLARTRIGPHIIGKDIAGRQHIDGGICVGAGCFLCGWSVLIETAARRKDMALFVAPRALATVVPRRYSLDKQWRETLVFAASTAVVFTCIAENPRKVRGVFGRMLGMVVNK